MKSIANRYKRGELVGIGFEADFGGCRCHCIAWENAQVERLRDDPIFTEGLVIDAFNLDEMEHPVLMLHYKEDAVKILADMESMRNNNGVVLVPGGCDFEEVSKLKTRIDELESHLTALTSLNQDELKLFLHGFRAANTGTYGDITGTYADVTGKYVEPESPIETVETPVAIATHKTIEPATTETPFEPIQEPVAAVVSELTASPPAQAPDTSVEAVAEVDPAKCVLGPHWEPTPGDSEAATIRSFLKRFGDRPNKEVIDTLKKFGVEVTASQVLLAKKAVKQ